MIFLDSHDALNDIRNMLKISFKNWPIFPGPKFAKKFETVTAGAVTAMTFASKPDLHYSNGLVQNLMNH